MQRSAGVRDVKRALWTNLGPRSPDVEPRSLDDDDDVNDEAGTTGNRSTSPVLPFVARNSLKVFVPTACEIAFKQTSENEDLKYGNEERLPHQQTDGKNTQENTHTENSCDSDALRHAGCSRTSPSFWPKGVSVTIPQSFGFEPCPSR